MTDRHSIGGSTAFGPSRLESENFWPRWPKRLATSFSRLERHFRERP